MSSGILSSLLAKRARIEGKIKPLKDELSMLDSVIRQVEEFQGVIQQNKDASKSEFHEKVKGALDGKTGTTHTGAASGPLGGGDGHASGLETGGLRSEVLEGGER